jgi:PAS domain S-box-containing protein
MIAQIINAAHYSVTLYAASSMLVGGAIAILGTFVLFKEHGSRVGLVFWTLTLCLCLWLVGFGAAAASPIKIIAHWWIRAAFMGVAFIPSLVLLLALEVAQRTHMSMKLIRASISVSTLICVSVYYPNLFMTSLYHYSWGYYAKFGPLGIAYLFYFGGVTVYVLRLYWTGYSSSTNEKRKKRFQGLLIAHSLGYVAAVDFFPALGVPIYPFGYVMIVPFLVITASVIVKYKLVDITPALAAEQILETMQGAVIAVDLEGKIRVVNRAAREMLGREQSELLNSSMTTLLDIAPEFLACAHTGNHGVSRDIRWPARSGLWSEVNIAVTPVTGGNKSTVGLVYVAYDITERKQAERSIKKLNEELEFKVQERTKQLMDAQDELVRREKLATLGQLAGTVGHELRNPLGVMSNAVYFLQTVLTGADETTKEYLGIIKSEIAAADRIVSELLDAVRTKPPHPQLVPAEGLIRMSLEKCRIPEGINVEVRSETQRSVLIDHHQVKQVFINLINNAVEAMPNGGRLTLGAADAGDGGGVWFIFKDEGGGIDPANREKIFQPLFTTKARGIGLGLAVVKNLTEANGGKISVESELGKGTTFSVHLPVAS